MNGKMIDIKNPYQISEKELFSRIPVMNYQNNCGFTVIPSRKSVRQSLRTSTLFSIIKYEYLKIVDCATSSQDFAFTKVKKPFVKLKD